MRSRVNGGPPERLGKPPERRGASFGRVEPLASQLPRIWGKSQADPPSSRRNSADAMTHRNNRCRDGIARRTNRDRMARNARAGAGLDRGAIRPACSMPERRLPAAWIATTHPAASRSSSRLLRWSKRAAHRPVAAAVSSSQAARMRTGAERLSGKRESARLRWPAIDLPAIDPRVRIRTTPWPPRRKTTGIGHAVFADMADRFAAARRARLELATERRRKSDAASPPPQDQGQRVIELRDHAGIATHTARAGIEAAKDSNDAQNEKPPLLGDGFLHASFCSNLFRREPPGDRLVGGTGFEPVTPTMSR